MSKKKWAGIICGILFPPLLFIPLIYYYVYLPLKEGVIRGSRLSFYFWATSILSVTAFSTLPVKNITTNLFQLNNITNTQNYIIASFIFSFLAIFMIFRSTRNEPDQNLFLGIRKFKVDKLFIISALMTLMPYSLLLEKNFTFENIDHPAGYAISFAFVNKYYFLAILGIFKVSILTAVLEESVFRGLFLRDYFGLRPIYQRILLASTAIYFGLVHIPHFIGPFIFALFINRIRIVYQNLLPCITLHALWNINVTIAILLVLNTSGAPIPKSSSVNEEIVKASLVWENRDVSLGKRYFEHEKLPENTSYDTFKGSYINILSTPDTIDKNRISKMILILRKPLVRLTVEYAYIADDWETRLIKKVLPNGEESEKTFRCTKKLDVCFKLEKESTSTIVHGFYDNPDVI